MSEPAVLFPNLNADEDPLPIFLGEGIDNWVSCTFCGKCVMKADDGVCSLTTYCRHCGAGLYIKAEQGSITVKKLSDGRKKK